MLTLAYEQSMEGNRQQNQLLAKIGHDIRTPLSAILGYGELLEQNIYGPLNDKQHGVISKIIDSAEQLLDFLNNLKKSGPN